ncbi:MAG: hypothetical protein Q8L81_19175 [Bacteroidota bacterium]|nr:hypothetical protein [Bacteroidota bacterium]
MKTTKFKAFLILVGSVLMNIQSMSAGTIDDVKKFAGDQMSNFNMQGLLVIGGIVGAGLLIYIVSNHLIKDKDEETVGHLGQNSNISRHNHHRHHHTRHIVKKTS